MINSNDCNKKIKRAYKRSVRLIVNDYESSFYDLFSSLNEKTIDQCCINVLLIEVYKYLDGLSPEFMNKVFYLHQNHYNLLF